MADEATPAADPLIDTALVSRLIASQFPQWADLAIHPVARQGWDNRTFRLGTEMSVRLPSAARYAAKVQLEQRWLPVLAARLPLPVPQPLALGEPAEGYPFHWSIYRWLPGDSADSQQIADPAQFAADLAHFLLALQAIDPTGAPRPGAHNFQRGGPLSFYDGETRAALGRLHGLMDSAAATAIWESAVSSSWDGDPVWLHGDLSAGNLLVDEGRLSAVIDFGGMAVGDPACDLAIAWTFLRGESRAAFRTALSLDEDSWQRGRGWALWKVLIQLAQDPQPVPQRHGELRRVLAEIIAG